MTIQEAWKKILEIRGERASCLTVDLWHYGHDPGKTEIKLSFWDGSTLLSAKNLDDLIKLAEVSVGKPGIVDGELPEPADQAEKG